MARLATVLVVALAGCANGGSRMILLPPETDTVWHGVWLPINKTVNQADIFAFEAQAGKKIGALMYFLGWYPDAW